MGWLFAPLDVCLSVWLSWVMTTPLQQSDRMVILADAYRFGVQYEAAKYHRIFAYKLKESIEYSEAVYVNYGCQGAFLWRQETQWRHGVWDSIEDALNTNLNVSYRLSALQKLRLLLGDEAFYDGWIPEPNPQMRAASVDR